MTRSPVPSTEWAIAPLSGEFLHPETELQFVREELRAISGYLQRLLPAFGLLFLSFSIPDALVLLPRREFWLLLAIRVLYLVYMVYLSRRMHRIRSVRVYHNLITVAKLTGVVLFLLAFILYETPHFMIQSMGLLTILIAFYLVPNRFSNHVMVSTLSIALFLNLSWIMLSEVDTMEMAASAVYLILITGLSSAAYTRVGLFKRRQFQANRQLQVQVMTDPMTGLFNRQKFNEELQREIHRSVRYHLPLSIVMLDLDNFKAINDRYGHICGDRVLVALAELLQEQVRITDILARWGGEEFILLLPSTPLRQAIELTERLRHIVGGLRIPDCVPILSEVHQDPEPVQLGVACSYGVTERRPDDTAAAFLHRADQLMYQAKSNGKDRVESA